LSLLCLADLIFFAGNDMLSEKKDPNSSIKSILASATAGRSVIPALQKVVKLDVDGFLQLYLKPFADIDPRIAIPEGKTKKQALQGSTVENQQWLTSFAYALAIMGLKNPNKLALGFGARISYFFSCQTSDVIDLTHSGHHTECGSAAAKYYPLRTYVPRVGGHSSIMSDASKGLVRRSSLLIMVQVYKVLIQDSNGHTHATTYFAVQEHTEASQAGDLSGKEHTASVMQLTIMQVQRVAQNFRARWCGFSRRRLIWHMTQLLSSDHKPIRKCSQIPFEARKITRHCFKI